MRIDCDTCGSNRQKTHCVLGVRSANPKRWRSAPKTQFILPPWGDQTGTLSATTHQRTMLSNSRNDVPITGLDFHALHDSNAVRLDTHRRNDEMPRAKKSEGNLEAITARRAAIEAELVELAEAERRASEAERGAGRDVFLGALGKVKIGRIGRAHG